MTIATLPLVEEPSRFGTPEMPVHLTSWETFGENVYVCRVLICPKPDGGYSAVALRLPHLTSEGETISAAIKTIREAFRQEVLTCRRAGREIPWRTIEFDRPSGSVVRHVLVNVQDLEDIDDVLAIEEARQSGTQLPYEGLRQELGLS